MNLTLDGLETHLAKHFGKPKTVRGSANKVYLVRYADDFIITGITPSLLEAKVKPLVEEFLSKRGLRLSQKKTKITSIHQGFDFLGQTVKKYRQSKLLIQPSKKSQKAFRDKVKLKMRKLKTAPQSVVIDTLNPIITGWGNYHKHVVSKKVFSNLDHWIWQKLWKWSYQRHPNKNKTWVAKKYFHSIDMRNWEYSCKNKKFEGNDKPKVIKRLSAIPIRRQIKIKKEANPYDPAWELYFERRNDAQMKSQDRGRVNSLYKRQRGECGICKQNITQETGWNVHHVQEKIKGGSELLNNLMLLHPYCHRQLHARQKAGLSVADSLPHA